MDLGLRGRRALITGAAGGIGRATAQALADEGARLALTDREGPALTDAATAVGAAGLAADITDAVAVAEAVAEAAQRLGGLDLLVCSAGVSGPVGTALADTDPADWAHVFAVNVGGAFHALRAAVPFLRRSDAASVVLVASDSALVATPGMVPYCASKAAVLQLARAAATELAADGIRVTAVCPSIVDTPMSRGDLDLSDGFAGVDYPVQTAADVAAQIAWLCAPVSRAVNATGVVMDFGFSARSNFPA
jgi:dihydroanticapsin dehydrogenase